MRGTGSSYRIIQPKGIANRQHVLTNLQIVRRTDGNRSGQITGQHAQDRQILFGLKSNNGRRQRRHALEFDLYDGIVHLRCGCNHVVVGDNVALVVPQKATSSALQ